MTKTIKGKFSIKSTPYPPDDAIQKIGAMNMRFDKTFSGGLEAISIVSMIGVMNRDLNSGGYVAIERVTGKLEQLEGSFSLQHSSVMNRGLPTQTISVIPDSGTGELVGLSGSMIIDIIDGQHFYTFEYSV